MNKVEIEKTIIISDPDFSIISIESDGTVRAYDINNSEEDVFNLYDMIYYTNEASKFNSNKIFRIHLIDGRNISISTPDDTEHAIILDSYLMKFIKNRGSING